VTPVDGEFYVTWCNGYHGPTIGIARTKDFVHFEQLENAFLPYNRNGVLFPAEVQREISHAQPPERHRAHAVWRHLLSARALTWSIGASTANVMGRGWPWWQGTKIGAGPSPIETNEGWLLFYHGVTQTCNGFVYAMSAALLDLEQPWKVIACCNQQLLCPEAPYELSGFVPGVCFPVGCLCDSATGRTAIYYGRRGHVHGAVLLRSQ